ncbi:MAG: type II toxin-antitoxin system VapC family toxin [Caulobacterales bacterium]|nr:type II toxin-antitoxin system VapC family toxin [Caulobacterales bacterium]
MYLLDTDVVLAAIFDSVSLTARARNALADPNNERRVSVVSAFEIAVKHTLGKLPLPVAFDQDFSAAFEDVLVQLAATSLEVRLPHAFRVRRLPLHHRDPFDRLLIAQALEENLTMVSGDRQFAAYDGLRLMPA